MKILVCIKQVPDLENLSEIAIDSGWIQEVGTTIYKMNHFDEFALEEAVRIKEAVQDCSIDVISVGPDNVDITIERALAKGADNGIHIRHQKYGYCPPLSIATFIAAYAKENFYDLILTGVMAEDDMQCQVGPLLATLLDIPCATAVIREDIEYAARKITVVCELEGGLSEKVRLPLPALLTIQSGINQPRYPSLSNMLRARSQKLLTIDASSLPTPAEKETFLAISQPVKSSNVEIIYGSPESKADKLVNLLHQKAVL